MAKINWLLGESYWDGFNSDYAVTMNKSGTRATYHFEDGARAVFNGKHLEMTDGEITGGSVSKVTFLNADDEVFITAKGHYRAASLGQGAFENDGYGIHQALYDGDDFIFTSRDRDTVEGGGGDDQIVGGRAADYLNGETGDDKLTGGKGSDYFVVDDDDGVGHEVITDLHTKGAAKDDFYTDLDIVTTKSVHRHEDTLLIASNGSTILLENVTKQEWLDFITL